MRIVFYKLCIALVIMAGACSVPTSSWAQQPSGLNYIGVYNNNNYEHAFISFKDFYENLAPYGQWMLDERLGYVWIPEVEESFRPYYTKGQWVVTDYGNTWVSEYQWGWACFHYGRWTYDPYYGWIWVPGSSWAPAWVSWRAGTGSFGWAPLTPNYEYDPANLVDYTCPNDWWVFLPPQYLYGGNYYRYWYGPQGNTNLIKHSTVLQNAYTAGNATYFFGPRPDAVEKLIGKPVKIHKMIHSSVPRKPLIYNDMVKMFKPLDISPTSATGEKIFPPNAIVARKPINKVAPPLNGNKSSVAPYKFDIPSNVLPPAKPVVPTVAPNISVNGPSKEAERADKFQYETSVKPMINNRQREYSNWVPKRTAALPNQNTQSPEPVQLPNQAPASIPKATQKADPIPTIGGETEERAIPIPTQHPEPIREGIK